MILVLVFLWVYRQDKLCGDALLLFSGMLFSQGTDDQIILGCQVLVEWTYSGNSVRLPTVEPLDNGHLGDRRKCPL